MQRDLSVFFISMLLTLSQAAAGKTPDLTFNIPHKKSKASVYRTVIHFFEKNGKKYDCRLGSYKDFNKGVITVFSFYRCDTVAKSYKLAINVSDKTVMLNYSLSVDKSSDMACINKTYDRWIEIRDSLAHNINLMKDVASVSVPPDVPAGSGFKNFTFGLDRDSVTALLEMNGYIEGDHQVSLHPRFHENYYEKVTSNGIRGFILIIRIGEYTAKVHLDFTPDDIFYRFRIALPSKTAAYAAIVKEKDCVFLTNVFKKKYGAPDTTYNPVLKVKPPPKNMPLAVWDRKQYAAYTALSISELKYSALGVVKSKSLEKAVLQYNKNEHEKKMKNASQQF